MKARLLYITQNRQFGLLALAAIFLAGCWKEVHYEPPTGDEAMPVRAARQPVSESPRDDEDATRFADDFASTFEPEPDTPPESGPLFDDTEETTRYADTTPIPDDESPRYADSHTLQEPSSETPPPATAADPAANTRRIAWLLGSKLSLAALANERGGDPAEVQKWFQQSQTLATLLGSDVDPLPPVPSGGTPANGVEYIFDQGQRIGRDLATGHSDDHAALFELAVKSYVLLALYQPHAPVAQALSEAVANAGQRAGLPAELFEPLTTAVANGDSHAVVRDAVLQLNQAVDARLSAEQP